MFRPYPPNVRLPLLALGKHNNLRKVPDEMLFGKGVKPTGEQAHLNELKRIFVVEVPLL